MDRHVHERKQINQTEVVVIGIAKFIYQVHHAQYNGIL